MNKANTVCYCLVVLAMAGCCATLLVAQQISGVDRERAKVMLAQVSADIKKHYYDPKFHGVDWDAKINETRDKIDHSASINVALSHIAAALDSLSDTHTFFQPPARPYRIDFGYELEMIGDKCFVVQVRPQSNADAKGLVPGDEVLAFNGYTPTRDDLWKMEFVYRYLRPQPQIRFDVRSPDGKERTVSVEPRVQVTSRVIDGETDFWKVVNEEQNLEHLRRLRSVTVDDLMIMKMPTFEFTSGQISDVMDKARSYKSLIIDLRADGGGSTETLKSLIGAVFDHDVKIADRIGREKPSPFIAKSQGKNAFTGKLIVLVDSGSASASELFARVIQLEKRGIVVGDRSSGSVMEARSYGYEAGTGSVVFFGAQITDADLIMVDGKSLEHVGVTPDETIVPMPADLAANRDPVLSRAAELAGVKLTPEKAGELLPFEWKKF